LLRKISGAEMCPDEKGIDRLATGEEFVSPYAASFHLSTRLGSSQAANTCADAPAEGRTPGCSSRGMS